MILVNFIIQSSLLSAGIISAKRYRKYQLYLMLGLATNAIIFIIGISFCILTTPVTTDQILLFCYLGGVSSYFVLQCITRLNEPILLYLVDELKENLLRENFISRNTKARMRKKFYPLLIALVITTNTILFSPMFSFFWVELKDQKYNDPDFYLLLNTFTSWQVNSTFELIVKNLVHIFMVLPGTFCYLGATALISYITSNLEAHAAQLNNDFSVIFNPNTAQMTQKQRDIMLKRDLKVLIKYLQYIYRYSKSFTTYVEWTVHTCLFWFMNGLILILHVLIQVEDAEAIVFIKNMAILMLVFLQFYICCNITESLSHLNENLLYSMYNSGWYQAPAQHRDTLVTMMLHWQCPLQIKLFNMYVMNLNLFAKCFRIIYSVLNVTVRVLHR